RSFEAENLPSLTGIDLIIALGGPMSVNDDGQFPWLREEKHFIAEAVGSGCAVLGICLGSQLIASALGACVCPGSEKEIGWFPVFAESPESGAFAFPERVEVFHWHGEMFELPTGAVLLASSVGCVNQAFQVGNRTMGLQFHLETTPDSASVLIDHCSDELVPQPHIQTESELRAVPNSNYAGINALMTQVLDYLVSDMA